MLTITDHREQKLYMFSTEKDSPDSLQLRNTLDLTKTGQAVIEMQKGPEPSTRPSGRGK